MPRPLRIDPPDGWHHVMNRGVNHQAVFFADQDRVEFGRLLGVVHEQVGVETHAYCLLDNHYHLLLRCPDGGLSTAMQTLGSWFTRHVNDRVGRDGPLFRGRFHSRHIDTDAYLLNVVRYIHRNALDVVGVNDVGDYRWSSHRTYLGHRQRPEWMQIDFILDQFGGSSSALHRFVVDEAIPGHIPTGLTPDMILAAIELVVAEHEPRLTGSSRPFGRVLGLFIAEQLAAPDVLPLLAALGIKNAAALRTALYRARRRRHECRDVDTMLAATMGLLTRPVTLGV